MTHPVSRYVPLLIDGDVEGLLDLFGNAPRINDPRLGWIEGAAFEPFVAASFDGLAERQASVEHLTTTSTPLAAVEECIVSLVRRGETVRLPVALAAVIASGVERYHAMLAAGNASGMLEQFDVGGLVREADGEDDIHQGRSELQQFFGKLFSLGGISLDRCSSTDDGTSCALEYNLTTWGRVLLPHQAGIAVYERSGAGVLAAVRLYDDIARPPAPS